MWLWRIWVKSADAKIQCNHYSDVIISTMASPITSLTIVYSTVYSGADERKHQNSASLALVRGIHRWPVNSPHKGPVTRKMFPFDDVIMTQLSADSVLKSMPDRQRRNCYGSSSSTMVPTSIITFCPMKTYEVLKLLLWIFFFWVLLCDKISICRYDSLSTISGVRR